MKRLKDICSFVYNKNIQISILVLITLNAISLGLETNKSLSPSFLFALEIFDNFALYVYVLELTLKHIASGFKFWKNGWNIFDFFVVVIAFVPAGSSMSVLRGFRIIRVLRLLSSIQALRSIILGLFKSLPSIGWLSLLMMIVFYIFAVMGTNFFGEKFPEFFGTLGKSSYTLFQTMTLESWSMGIARPIAAQYQYAYLYFLTFIMINTFIMLNLFVGIIVNAMGNTPDNNSEESSQEDNQLEEGESKSNESDIHEQIILLRKQILKLEEQYSKIILKENQHKKAQIKQ